MEPIHYLRIFQAEYERGKQSIHHAMRTNYGEQSVEEQRIAFYEAAQQ